MMDIRVTKLRNQEEENSLAGDEIKERKYCGKG